MEEGLVAFIIGLVSGPIIFVSIMQVKYGQWLPPVDLWLEKLRKKRVLAKTKKATM